MVERGELKIASQRLVHVGQSRCTLRSKTTDRNSKRPFLERGSIPLDRKTHPKKMHPQCLSPNRGADSIHLSTMEQVSPRIPLRCVKMREMQGAEDEPAGSLHIVNDQGRIPIATPQIAYFHAPIKKFASLSRNINSPFFPHCNFAPVKGAHIVLVSI